MHLYKRRRTTSLTKPIWKSFPLHKQLPLKNCMFFQREQVHSTPTVTAHIYHVRTKRTSKDMTQCKHEKGLFLLLSLVNRATVNIYSFSMVLGTTSSAQKTVLAWSSNP